MIESVYYLFSCWIGPYSTGRARGAGAVSSRLPAFCSGPVPASCCCHRPHPALRVEASSFWHQPRLWPIRLPAEEQRSHQVRRDRERDKTCICTKFTEFSPSRNSLLHVFSSCIVTSEFPFTATSFVHAGFLSWFVDSVFMSQAFFSALQPLKAALS